MQAPIVANISITKIHRWSIPGKKHEIVSNQFVRCRFGNQQINATWVATWSLSQTVRKQSWRTCHTWCCSPAGKKRLVIWACWNRSTFWVFNCNPFPDPNPGCNGYALRCQAGHGIWRHRHQPQWFLCSSRRFLSDSQIINSKFLREKNVIVVLWHKLLLTKFWSIGRPSATIFGTLLRHPRLHRAPVSSGVSPRGMGRWREHTAKPLERIFARLKTQPCAYVQNLTVYIYIDHSWIGPWVLKWIYMFQSFHATKVTRARQDHPSFRCCPAYFS